MPRDIESEETDEVSIKRRQFRNPSSSRIMSTHSDERDGIGLTHPPKIGNRGVRSASDRMMNGKALYPRYVTYTYCTAAMRKSVLRSVNMRCSRQVGLGLEICTHFPKNKHIQLSLTKTPARGNSPTPTLIKLGTNAFTATSNAYANSTRESSRPEECEVGARSRRFVSVYRRRAVRRDRRRKSPGITCQLVRWSKCREKARQGVRITRSYRAPEQIMRMKTSKGRWVSHSRRTSFDIIHIAPVKLLRYSKDQPTPVAAMSQTSSPLDCVIA